MNDTVYFDNLSWNSSDLVACRNAACIVLDTYGVNVLIELSNECAFGNLDISDLLED